MEIAIAGEGEVVIRFIDPKGRTLIEERLTVCGSPTVEARRAITLCVETTSGGVLVSPVLVRQSNPRQRVMFDGERPSRFTRKRCKEIGCTTGVAKEAERGCAAPPKQGGPAVLLSDDQAVAGLILAAARGEKDRSE